MPHFEIHVTDMNAAKAFYGELFGWDFTLMPGAEEMEYHLIEGRDIGVEKPLSGGMMTRTGPASEAGAPIRGGTMTFQVDDCDERYSWALANGGAEAVPPTDYPGIGRCAYVEDGHGNVVGFITPTEGAD